MNREDFDIFITNELKEIKASENLKHRVHNEIVYTLKSKKRSTSF